MDAATYIGNGPYKIAEWVPSSHITMVKNENYWNVDSLAGPDTLQFTLMEDDAAQLTAFQSGELDFIDAVPNDEIDALSSTPEFYKEGQIGTYYVSYNTQAAPFDDPLVRQAFTLAGRPRLYLQADRQIRPDPGRRVRVRGPERCCGRLFLPRSGRRLL